MNFRFTSSCPHWRKFYMQIIFRIHSTVMTYPEMVDLTQTSHPLAHLLVGFLALNITRWPKFDMNFAKFGDSYSKHIQFHRSFVTCSEESHYHQRPFNGGPIYCCFFSFLFFFAAQTREDDAEGRRRGAPVPAAEPAAQRGNGAAPGAPPIARPRLVGPARHPGRRGPAPHRWGGPVRVDRHRPGRLRWVRWVRWFRRPRRKGPGSDGMRFSSCYGFFGPFLKK